MSSVLRKNTTITLVIFHCKRLMDMEKRFESVIFVQQLAATFCHIITKIDYTSKTRVPKKTIDVKNHYQINPDLSCKFGHLWRKITFFRVFLDLLDDYNSKTRYDLIWYYFRIFWMKSHENKKTPISYSRKSLRLELGLQCQQSEQQNCHHVAKKYNARNAGKRSKKYTRSIRFRRNIQFFFIKQF